MSFLKFAFRGHLVFDFIERQELWLFTPAHNSTKWWYLVNELDWSAILRPGLRLEMSINLRRKVASECALALGGIGTVPLTIEDLQNATIQPAKFVYLSACSSANANDRQNSLVHFTKPLPPWLALPEDLEFRWLYVERVCLLV